MTTNSKEARERAEARFARTQKTAQEGKEARRQYEADGVALRARTVRLKALRLAREAGTEGKKKS